MKVILENRLATGGLGTVRGRIKGHLYDESNQKWTIIDVRDMRDGRGNDLKVYLKKIKQVVRKLGRKRRVVICCKMGRSRSMAIAVGVLIKEFKFSFSKALEVVNKMGARIHKEHLRALKEIFN